MDLITRHYTFCNRRCSEIMKLSIALIYCFMSVQGYAKHIAIRVPDKLHFVNMNNGFESYYELVLTNSGQDTMRLKKLEVLTAYDSTLLCSFGGIRLLRRYSRISRTEEDSTLLILPRSASVIYMELPLQRQPPNNEIIHRITIATPNGTDTAVKTMSTLCDFKDPIILGNPLSGGIWTAVYDPFWPKGHRRVIYRKDGLARIPGRYAIDFIQMDIKGNYAKGDENRVSNWLGYGADVLAVADGDVVVLKDDFPESSTLSGNPDYPPEEATGNYICLKISERTFVFYEHLKPYSIKVKTGQKVKKGDIIASLGFTGQTTGPHLHIHVADAKSALGSEGLPFAFEDFELLGHYPHFENFGKRPWLPRSSSKNAVRQNERPSPNAVIQFK